MQNVDLSPSVFARPPFPSELCASVAGDARARYARPVGPLGLLTPPPPDCQSRALRPRRPLPPTPPSFSPVHSQHLPHLPPRLPRLASDPSSPLAGAAAWSSSFLDPAQRLQFQRTLGSGAYGVVHLAKDVSTQIHYAVKVLNKFLPNGLPLDRRQQQFQQTEMRLHYQVSAHPNIVSLLRIMDTPQDTYVIMEFCPEGDLFLNITERGRYVGDDGAARQVFLQILDAVSHCHRLGIYHRDLKPENILVADDGRQVKLTDFGLATTEPYATEFGCGSTFYMSPECQDQHSGKAFYACAPNDVWSLGVVLVNLTCGRNPWKSASARDSTFRAFVEDRNFLKTILPLSDELNEILGMIFELDPARRIKLDELRRRIIQCRHFTNPPPPVYSSPTCFQEPLSPASSISDEGSMMSDHSDNSYASTDPSEVGSTVDCGLTTEILDEEYVAEVFALRAADDVKLPPSDHWSPSVHADEAPEAPRHIYVETHVPHPSRADPFVSRISNPSDAVHASQLIEVSPQRMNIPVHKGSEYPPFRSPSASPQSCGLGMNFANVSMPRVSPQGPPKRSYRRRSFLGNPWPRPVCPRINPHFVFPVHA